MAAQRIQTDPTAENFFVAGKLQDVADLLEQQAAALFRVRAYREAAAYVAALPQPIRVIYEKDGTRGLEDLPTIGVSIAAAIAELLDTRALDLLDRLRGSADPEKLFQTVPMIGPSLAHAIHETLHIDTLETLEAAAVDGRLAQIKGIGKRRVDSIRHSLSNMLARRRPSPANKGLIGPPVNDILAVDQEYRDSAETLPSIRPRRFNETGNRRIPILHTERGQWQYTALYSNTASANKYGRTHDWVVIYYEREGYPDGQSTVITARSGTLDGRRIVRGQEEACAQFYGL